MKLLIIRATFLALLALGATAGVAAADDLLPADPVDGPVATEPAVDTAESAADVARPASDEIAQATTLAAGAAKAVTQKAVRRVRPVVETGTQTAKDIAQPLAEPIAPVLETLEPAGNDLPLVGSLIWPVLPTKGLDPEPGADQTGDQPVSPTTDPIASGPTVAPPPLTAATGGVTGARATTTALADGAVSAMPLGPAHSPLTQTGPPMSAGIGHASTGGHWVAVLIGALLAAASGIGWRLFESALKPPGLLPVPAVPPA